MGDFKSEIEEQKKVHLCVDMTNISPPSEKNVPLTMVFCKNCKIFEITITVYSNSERSEQVLVTECFLTCGFSYI